MEADIAPGPDNLSSKRRAGGETLAEPRDAGANLALVVLEPDFCVLDRAGTRAVLSETDELDDEEPRWTGLSDPRNAVVLPLGGACDRR